MPRFYFHMIAANETVSDSEGTELASLEAARQEALADARSLMSDAIRKGYDVSSREIHIHDERDSLLLKVPYFEAVVRKD